MFAEVMRYLVTQNGRVEPLYELEKTGKLRADGTPGSTDGANSSKSSCCAGGEMLGVSGSRPSAPRRPTSTCSGSWPVGTPQPQPRNSGLRLSGRRCAAVAEGAHLLERDQPPADHRVDDWQEGVDLLLAVDDLDHQRQVHRQAQDFARVERLDLPKPIAPRSTVAPARCSSRALSTMTS